MNSRYIECCIVDSKVLSIKITDDHAYVTLQGESQAKLYNVSSLYQEPMILHFVRDVSPGGHWKGI